MTDARRLTEDWLRSAAGDIKIAALFSTSLPLPHATPIAGPDIARASWALPVVGVLLGFLGAAIYWIASRLALPPWVGSILTVATLLAATGCLHEDGLADTFDALGGGSRERKLEIMRDSRIGTYGACALATALLLRTAVLASLAAPGAVTLALICAQGGARATVPAFLYLVPPARSDGLSAAAGQPPASSVAAAALLGAVILLCGLGTGRTIVALLLLLALLGLTRRLALQQIGGQTGDVAGALEQIGEIAILLTIVAGRA